MSERTADVRSWLESYRTLMQEAKLAIMEAETQAEMATSITSALKDIVVKTSHRNDNMERRIIGMIDNGNDALDLYDKAEHRKRAIKKACLALNDDERAVILMRYIYEKQWKEIALTIGKDERSTYRIHGYALIKIKIVKDD